MKNGKSGSDLLRTEFKKFPPARVVLRALRRIGTWVIPEGRSNPYSFTHAKTYWQNVPRGFGATFNTRRLQDVSDEELLAAFEKELGLAENKSPERKVGFRKAMESIAGISRPNVMDYGAGMGFYGFEILALHPGAHVTFADINENNLKTVDRIAKRKNLHHRMSLILVRDEKAQDFHSDRQFDLVLSMGVLHHTPHARDIVRKITPFLKEGGIFQVMLYNDDFLRRAEQGAGRRLNTSAFGKVTDPEVAGLANPYSEAYDLEKTKLLFDGYEFVSVESPTVFYNTCHFKKTPHDNFNH